MNTAPTIEEVLDLWLTVPRIPISARERKLLGTAQTFTLPFTSTVRPAGSFDLPVSTWGADDRPLVQLVHGWGGHRGQLSAFAEPLVAAGFRVAACDAPSHGDTPGTQASGYQAAQALRAVAAEIGQPQAIVAHSFGATAVAVALQEGLHTEKLVFFGPTRRLEDTLEPFLKMSNLPIELTGELKRVTERDWGANVWERTALDQVLPKIPIPGLIFHDREDERTPYLSGVAVARAWKSARLITTHGLGHRGLLRDADVIRQVVEFLKS